MAFIEPRKDADVKINKKGQAIFRIHYEGPKRPDGSRNHKRLTYSVDPPDYRISTAKFIERARKQANDHAIELEIKAREETNWEPCGETFKELAERWLQYRAGKSRKGKSQPLTIVRYKSLLDRIYTREYFGIEFGDIEVSKIDIDIMEEFWHNFEKEKTANGKSVLSKQTVWHHYRVLFSVLEYGLERGLLLSNPCKFRKPESPDIKELNCYNESEVAKIMENLDSEPLQNKVLVSIALETGARVGEILALKWTDIDYENRLIKINKSWQYVKGLGSFEKPPKNNASNRRVPFSKTVSSLLKELEKKQEAKKKKIGTKWHDSEAVFIQWNGEQVHAKWASNWWHDYIVKTNAKCGIPIKNFHFLRHTCLSLLLLKGASPVEVARLAGHSTTATLLRTYAHAIKKEKFESASIMEGIMNKRQNDQEEKPLDT